jgi:hypothetical protein
MYRRKGGGCIGFCRWLNGEASETICQVRDSYCLPREGIHSPSATQGYTGVIIGKGECKEFPSDGIKGGRGWLVFGWKFDGTGNLAGSHVASGLFILNMLEMRGDKPRLHEYAFQVPIGVHSSLFHAYTAKAVFKRLPHRHLLAM